MLAPLWWWAGFVGVSGMELGNSFSSVCKVCSRFQGGFVRAAIVTLPADEVHDATIIALAAVVAAVKNLSDFVFNVAINFDRRRWRLDSSRDGVGGVGLE